MQRMTLQEKIGQLNLMVAGDITTVTFDIIYNPIAM